MGHALRDATKPLVLLVGESHVAGLVQQSARDLPRREHRRAVGRILGIGYVSHCRDCGIVENVQFETALIRQHSIIHVGNNPHKSSLVP